MTLTAIDVSNYQPRNLGPLIEQFNPDIVIVKLWLPEERVNQQYSIDQAASAHAHGKEVWGYFWAYADLSPEKSVADAHELAEHIGARRVWTDLEPYDGGYGLTWPDIEWMQRAEQQHLAMGRQPGIYSAKWYWDAFMGGTEQFSHLPLWAAQYNALPFTPFGGWTDPEGRQWTDHPIDQNTFRGIIMPDGRTIDQQNIINVAKGIGEGLKVDAGQLRQWADELRQLQHENYAVAIESLANRYDFIGDNEKEWAGQLIDVAAAIETEFPTV